MIVDAVPSGAVGNIAPRCWEGRKEEESPGRGERLDFFQHDGLEE